MGSYRLSNQGTRQWELRLWEEVKELLMRRASKFRHISDAQLRLTRSPFRSTLFETNSVIQALAQVLYHFATVYWYKIEAPKIGRNIQARLSPWFFFPQSEGRDNNSHLHLCESWEVLPKTWSRAYVPQNMFSSPPPAMLLIEQKVFLFFTYLA